MGTPANPTVDKFGRILEPVSWEPAGPASAVSFAFKNVIPPTALYVGRDDVMVLQGISNAGADIVTLNVRILTVDNVIVPMQVKVALPSNETLGSFVLQMVEGFLLSVSALASVATTRGQTFVRLFLNRGALGSGQPGQVLFSDYLTSQISNGYPFGRFVTPVEGPGFIGGLTVTQPGAGVDWGVNVTGGERWKVRCMNATLATSAAVANRQPQLLVFDTIMNLFVGNPSASIPASTTAQVSFSAAPLFAETVTTDISVQMPPDLILCGVAGFLQSLKVVTVGLQAGDQWSNIRLHLERWLDNV